MQQFQRSSPFPSCAAPSELSGLLALVRSICVATETVYYRCFKSPPKTPLLNSTKSTAGSPRSGRSIRRCGLRNTLQKLRTAVTTPKPTFYEQVTGVKVAFPLSDSLFGGRSFPLPTPDALRPWVKGARDLQKITLIRRMKSSSTEKIVSSRGKKGAAVVAAKRVMSLRPKGTIRIELTML